MCSIASFHLHVINSRSWQLILDRQVVLEKHFLTYTANQATSDGVRGDCFHPLMPVRLIETSQLPPLRESFVTTPSHNGYRRSRLGEGRARRKPGTLSTPKERGSCSTTTTFNGNVLDRHLVISLSGSRRNGNVEDQYTTGSGTPSDRLEPDRNSAIAAQRDSGKIAEIAGIEESAAKFWRRERVSTPLAGARGICGRVRRSG